MKVFVAGASGVVGRPLVRQLVEAGHEVTGTTRREEKAGAIREAGADAVVSTSSTPRRCAKPSPPPSPRSSSTS